jgi:hypothetical protein
MIRALLLLLLAHLLRALSRSSKVVDRAVTAPQTPLDGQAKGQRLATERCACLLREVLTERGISGFLLERDYGVDERRLLAMRGGRVEPSLDEKLAILRAVNEIHPRSKKPRLGYEELWGEKAKPRNCTCDVRRFLDLHELTADFVAQELGVEKKKVLRWRSGASSPTDEEWTRVRELARERRGTLEFRSRDVEQRYLA